MISPENPEGNTYERPARGGSPCPCGAEFYRNSMSVNSLADWVREGPRAVADGTFSADLAQRTGFFPQYHSSDITALHISYLRRKFASERAVRTCNLRKSPGAHLVAQGADPLPSPEDAEGFYRVEVCVEVCKDGPQVTLTINGLQIFDWLDNDPATGPRVDGGYLGLRQMAPLRAAYKNLTVTALPRHGEQTGLR